MPENKPQIVMRSGPIPGSSYYLEKAETLLGRDLSNDIPVPDPEISRRHVRFVLRSEGVYVEDLGSTNGTFVNGARISAPQLLHNGDLITLAESTVMSFEQPESGPVYGEALAFFNADEIPLTSAPHDYEPVAAPVPQQPLASAPAYEPEKAKMGWCSIILLILLISLVVIALVLVFMPTSWWCAISLNTLAGCPVP